MDIFPYNHYRWDNYDKNHLAQEAIFHFLFHTEGQWQYIPTYFKICWYDYYKSHVIWHSVNDIWAALQMKGQAVTKKWFVKINLSW